LELFDLFELYQVRREQGIAENLWEDKRAAIALEIDGLGEGYRDILRAGWVKYLANVNAHGSKIVPQSVQTVPSKIVVDDD